MFTRELGRTEKEPWVEMADPFWMHPLQEISVWSEKPFVRCAGNTDSNRERSMT